MVGRGVVHINIKEEQLINSTISGSEEQKERKGLVKGRINKKDATESPTEFIVLWEQG